jgi:hypothetical protein
MTKLNVIDTEKFNISLNNTADLIEFVFQALRKTHQSPDVYELDFIELEQKLSLAFKTIRLTQLAMNDEN